MIDGGGLSILVHLKMTWTYFPHTNGATSKNRPYVQHNHVIAALESLELTFGISLTKVIHSCSSRAIFTKSGLFETSKAHLDRQFQASGCRYENVVS